MMTSLFTGATSLVHAGTMGQITLPSKTTPYCDYMPFDFVDSDQQFSNISNRIWVKQPVTFTVTSPKHFGGASWAWLTNGNNPLNGLNVIYKNTIIKPVKVSETKYQYTLPMLKLGDFYAFVGTLKYPSKGLKVCVN